MPSIDAFRKPVRTLGALLVSSFAVHCATPSAETAPVQLRIVDQSADRPQPPDCATIESCKAVLETLRLEHEQCHTPVECSRIPDERPPFFKLRELERTRDAQRGAEAHARLVAKAQEKAEREPVSAPTASATGNEVDAGPPPLSREDRFVEEIRTEQAALVAELRALGPVGREAKLRACHSDVRSLDNCAPLVEHLIEAASDITEQRKLAALRERLFDRDVRLPSGVSARMPRHMLNGPGVIHCCNGSWYRTAWCARVTCCSGIGDTCSIEELQEWADGVPVVQPTPTTKPARGATTVSGSSEDAPLVCNDGELSPTCTCLGNHRGCCSHHGGIRGCAK